MSDEDVKTLKEWALSTFVQKDACTVRHEKTDEKINTIIIEVTQSKVQLSIIKWVGTIAAGASITTLIAAIFGAIRV